MSLRKFLLAVLLLLLLNCASYAATSWEDDEFLKTCSSHRCHKHGPEIRFPFRLPSHPLSCGAPGMQLSCSGHDTILDHPVLGSCKVTAIYYRHRVMNIILPADSSSHCPLQKLVTRNQSIWCVRTFHTHIYRLVSLSTSRLLKRSNKSICCEVVV